MDRSETCLQERASALAVHYVHELNWLSLDKCEDVVLETGERL
jgi:hypothetical protein